MRSSNTTPKARTTCSRTVRAALTQTQAAVPVFNGALALGTWQGVFVYEHRHRGHTREVALHLACEQSRVRSP